MYDEAIKINSQYANAYNNKGLIHYFLLKIGNSLV